MNINEAAALIGSIGGKSGIGDAKRRSSESMSLASKMGHRDKSLSDAERIQVRIRVGSGSVDCWNWTSTLNKKGYGVIYVRGKKWFAHRFSWTVAHGPILGGLCVCHRCDNPKCVNPAHLFLGTNLDNIADSVNKGRQHGPEPDKTNTCKLSWDKVRQIRESKEPYRIIAARFGVTKDHISDIRRGNCWR